MYNIEKYLKNHGFEKVFDYGKSLVYSNRENTTIMLIPERKIWEINAEGPYLIAVGMNEPKSDLADAHAKLLKDFINDYMLPLRKDLLSIDNPWEEID